MLKKRKPEGHRVVYFFEVFFFSSAHFAILCVFPYSLQYVQTGFFSSPQSTRNGSNVSYNPQIHPTLTSYHANFLQFEENTVFLNHMSELFKGATVYYACIATAYDKKVLH